MDTLAHGLWGGVAFGRASKRDYILAFLLGMLPDLLSFGPFFLGWALQGFPEMMRSADGPPDPSIIPRYVYQMYNVTHSLVVWAAVAFLFK